MKRFFVFTLTLLFATVCLFLTDLSAFDSDWEYDTLFDGTVYGETNAWTSFDASSETAYSSHSVYVWNDGPGSVKFYSTATAQVFWNGGSASPPPREDSDILEANSSGSASESFSFLLRNKEAGPGHISATTALDVRHIPTNVRLSWPTASTTTSFTLQ